MAHLKKIVIKSIPFDVLVEDGKEFIGYAFMIITTDLEQKLYIVSSLDENKNATFFSSGIIPRADCRTLAQLATLRLRETSRNLFSLQGLPLNLYQDVPSFFSSKLFFRVYFLKIPCVHRVIFEKNKDMIDRAHSSGRNVPVAWREVNALTFLPIDFINFDMLDPNSVLLDDGGKKIALGKLNCSLLKASGGKIMMMCKDPKIITVCSVKSHTSSSWTNGTCCYYYGWL